MTWHEQVYNYFNKKSIKFQRKETTITNNKENSNINNQQTNHEEFPEMEQYSNYIH